MREVEKEVVSHKTVFVATDGTEFQDKTECIEYEKSALGVVRTKAAKLITFDTRKTNEDGWSVLGGMNDNEVIAFKPATQEDCDTLLQLILLENPYWARDDMKEDREERYKTIVEAWKNNDVVIFGINCDGELYFINSRQNIINNLHNMDLILDKEATNG